MEENPYQPPQVDAPTLAEEQTGSKLATRPLGIAILSWLHFLAGLVFLAAAVLFAVEAATGFSGMEIFSDAESQVQVPFWFAIAVSGFYAMLGASIGIGLWQGARWGWWLAMIYYVWWVLDLVAGIARAVTDADVLDREIVGRLLVGNLIHVAILVLVALYFFKGSVREFFGLQSLRMIPALNVLVAISIALLAASFAVVYFQIGGD